MASEVGPDGINEPMPTRLKQNPSRSDHVQSKLRGAPATFKIIQNNDVGGNMKCQGDGFTLPGIERHHRFGSSWKVTLADPGRQCTK